MNKPTVSVLLPNLNHLAFLQRRTDSILNQTLKDWELIVVDSYSTDGSWEFFQDLAKRDNRVKISQAPKGLYQSWNRCLKQVSGEFVYIATSDDSMQFNALEKMVEALREHPECGICDSQLEMVDESDRPIEGTNDSLFFYRYLGSLISKKHIRRRPHDGIVYLSSNSVYTSMTQILFRRSLLQKVGPFKTKWGSKCDYEWGIRASFSTDTIYLPEKLSQWRRHVDQATAKKPSTPAHQGRLEMAMAALDDIEDFQFLDQSIHSRREELLSFLKFEAVKDKVRFSGTDNSKVLALFELWLGSGQRSYQLWKEQFGKLIGKRVTTSLNEINRFKDRYDLNTLIEVID